MRNNECFPVFADQVPYPMRRSAGAGLLNEAHAQNDHSAVAQYDATE